MQEMIFISIRRTSQLKNKGSHKLDLSKGGENRLMFESATFIMYEKRRQESYEEEIYANDGGCRPYGRVYGVWQQYS